MTVSETWVFVSGFAAIALCDLLQNSAAVLRGEHCRCHGISTAACPRAAAALYDDPLLENTETPCGGELAVTAPFGGKPNYGTFSVEYNKLRWHLETAAFLEYFGAPTKTTGSTIRTWRARSARMGR